ncbi:type II toxin-antitoxin system Phd/YefM family antitoxin [Ruminococcus albus]|uniref:Antitoxin n=1 Tax=Ruminococcus albus (strain ATCC 27210 / DSM 20455 / JCM 14654 / NCDO 2250 / 7) TaxID=697329 RepID=E6UJP6_RUMA7|nr:type II toxin-antitoxin system prevent-host-death family antitoxin [Ruminococcus albus]ADU23892.1 prevent-host-death family protein [Ruminococcus albus 7 = DSM 20455]
MMIATATDMQLNFSKYLQAVQQGDEVIILKNGKEVARLIPYDASISFLTDSLMGILQNDYEDKAIHAERTDHEDLS